MTILYSRENKMNEPTLETIISNTTYEETTYQTVFNAERYKLKGMVDTLFSQQNIKSGTATMASKSLEKLDDMFANLLRVITTLKAELKTLAEQKE